MFCNLIFFKTTFIGFFFFSFLIKATHVPFRKIRKYTNTKKKKIKNTYPSTEIQPLLTYLEVYFSRLFFVHI